MSLLDVAEDPAFSRIRNTSLRRAARVMGPLVILGAALSLCALAWVWLSPERVSRLVAGRLGLADAGLALDGWSRGMGLAVSMLPLGALFYALDQVRRMSRRLAQGALFWEELAGRLGRAAWALLAVAALQPAADALLSIILTASNGPQGRHLVLAVGTDDVAIALVGGLLMVLGQVMGEAGLIAQDNRQIV